MTKTLGQIAFEAGQEATIEMMKSEILDRLAWDDIGPHLQRCHEITANAIIEECAKAAEVCPVVAPVSNSREEIASAIRALKSKTEERSAA